MLPPMLISFTMKLSVDKSTWQKKKKIFDRRFQTDDPLKLK